MTTCIIFTKWIQADSGEWTTWTGHLIQTFQWQIEAAKSVSSQRVSATLQHNRTRLESLHHFRHNLPSTTAASALNYTVSAFIQVTRPNNQ